MEKKGAKTNGPAILFIPVFFLISAALWDVNLAVKYGLIRYTSKDPKRPLIILNN